ncbi:MAG: LLM class flavin-dependent oxidoreductase [Gammaproteobacteria bacterium]
MSAIPVTSRRFGAAHRFKLGLFSFNHDGGLTHTLAPARWAATWDNTRALAQAAEAADLDFLLPLATWVGSAGDCPTDDWSFETLTWAAGLLAETSRIHVFATVHAPFLNPVFAAKQCATCDHIGAGRFGLNVVAGYHKIEFAVHGVPYFDHDTRYAYLDEWLALVRRMWQARERFDFKGRFFDLKGVISAPPPYGGAQPIVVSAGSSPTGRAFALRAADALFMLIPDLDTLADELVATRAAMAARPIDIYASGHVICRRTAAETREYYRYLIEEHGDWRAGRNMRDAYAEIKSVPEAVYSSPAFLDRLMTGSGTFQVIGDPDHVVDTFARIHAAGVNGMAIALPDYLADFEIIRDEVLPRMVARGLRVAERAPA